MDDHRQSRLAVGQTVLEISCAKTHTHADTVFPLSRVVGIRFAQPIRQSFMTSARGMLLVKLFVQKILQSSTLSPKWRTFCVRSSTFIPHSHSLVHNFCEWGTPWTSGCIFVLQFCVDTNSMVEFRVTTFGNPDRVCVSFSSPYRHVPKSSLPFLANT